MTDPQYCRHLKWLLQVEGDGDYRCELGNKTSCEWCETKGKCGDYETIPASDTPQPDTGKQPERHCEHECVCWFANGGEP